MAQRTPLNYRYLSPGRLGPTLILLQAGLCSPLHLFMCIVAAQFSDLLLVVLLHVFLMTRGKQ